MERDDRYSDMLKKKMVIVMIYMLCVLLSRLRIREYWEKMKKVLKDEGSRICWIRFLVD